MSSFRLVTAATGANPDVGDLYLDASGQFEWIGGDIGDTTSYARMIAQRIKSRTLQLRGEWYLDQRTGTPWAQRLWRKGANAATLRQVMRQVIEGTPGVRQINTLEVQFNPATREATVQYQVSGDMNQIVSPSQLDEPLIINIPETFNG